jgi:hypothetical protein
MRIFGLCYDALPSEIQKQADKQFTLFVSDPDHPSLRLKPVGAVWSVRVTKSYRALARRRGDSFYWFWIGTHADYDKLLAALQ